MTKPGQKFTMTLIADVLRRSLITLRRLPKVAFQDFKSNRSFTINEFREAYG
jgi:hypothetical protein